MESFPLIQQLLSRNMTSWIRIQSNPYTGNDRHGSTMVSIILWKSVRFFTIYSLKKTSQVEIWKMVWTNVFFFQFSGIRSPQGKCSPPRFQWLKNPGMGTFIGKFKFKELPRGAYPQWTSLKAKLIFGLMAAFESGVSRFCKYTTLLISLDLSVTLLCY